MRDFVTKAFEALSWIVFAVIILLSAVSGYQGAPMQGMDPGLGLVIGILVGAIIAIVLFGIIFAILDMKDSLDKIVVLLQNKK